MVFLPTDGNAAGIRLLCSLCPTWAHRNQKRRSKPERKEDRWGRSIK
jgi:hypothetical protein